ncbi:MAG TPA: Gfo/Idh/MocA family oxidoreductase [Devosia sp.]|nr:Gfo/Idh/MocA family oxidoreductase [Devosia sp.]
MTSSPIGLGLIGCGWAAGEIVRASTRLPTLRILAAYDTDRARAEALASKAAARVTDSVDATIADPEISTIYVGVPHALIAPIVRRALDAGKHILAEKPLSLDPAESIQLGEIADSKGLKLAVFFELRRASTVAAAKRIVDNGEIGVPRLIRMRTIIDKRADYWGLPGSPNWRASREMAGGGVLLMNNIHQLDTLRYVTGLDYVSATGEIATFSAAADVEDAGSATLRLSNGAILNVVASAHSPGANHEETIEIDGSEGRLDIPDPFGISPLRLYRSETKVWNEIAVDRVDSHLKMLQSFAESILKDSEVPASAKDAAAAVAAVQAIYRSAAERRTVDI